MENFYQTSVTPELSGERLDKFLIQASLDPKLTRTRLQQLIQDGFLRSDEETITSPSYKVKTGQNFFLQVPPLIDSIPLPQTLPLKIVYEDDDIIVIDKDPGMVVHPAPGNLDRTLVNALLAHCKETLSGISGVRRPGIVHRLDKGTSGLLVVAKHDAAHHHLADQFSSRSLSRTYQAVIWGYLAPTKGTIEGNIGRSPHNRQKMAITTRGKPAITHYHVLKYLGKYAALVTCRLETGRTHQIRVHLASKGHGIVGDPLYGQAPSSLDPDLKLFLKNNNWTQNRQALHAVELALIHPRTNEKMVFCSNLHEDMNNLIIKISNYT